MDEYERRHFRGEGRVLLRDKVVIGRGGAAAIALTGLGFVVAGVAGLAMGSPPLAIMGLSFGLPIMGILPVFGVVRMLVTERELRIQVGVGGPRVDIDEIDHWLVLGPDERGAPKAKEYPLKNGEHGLELHLKNAKVVRIRTDEARIGRLASALEEACASSRQRARVELGLDEVEEVEESASRPRAESEVRRAGPGS